MTKPQFTPTPDLPQEEWRPVLGFVGVYEVSNLGRLRRVGVAGGAQVGRVLAVSTSGFGYASVRLYHGKQSRATRVHRLVIESFNGPIPDGLIVNHIDSNPANNRLDNLEVVTQRENVAHCIAAGRHCSGERSGGTHLREQDVRAIRLMHELRAPLGRIAEIYGVTPQTVCDIAKRRSWKHVA